MQQAYGPVATYSDKMTYLFITSWIEQGMQTYFNTPILAKNLMKLALKYKSNIHNYLWDSLIPFHQISRSSAPLSEQFGFG